MKFSYSCPVLRIRYNIYSAFWILKEMICEIKNDPRKKQAGLLSFRNVSKIAGLQIYTVIIIVENACFHYGNAEFRFASVCSTRIRFVASLRQYAR